MDLWFLRLLYFFNFFSLKLSGKSEMVSLFVILMELVQLNCRMKELFKHDYCYFRIKANLRIINFKRKDLAIENV